jgi:hypothetical protein
MGHTSDKLTVHDLVGRMDYYGRETWKQWTTHGLLADALGEEFSGWVSCGGIEGCGFVVCEVEDGAESSAAENFGC